MSKKFEELVLEKLNSLQDQLAVLNNRFDKFEVVVNARFDLLEQRMEKIEQRMEKVEQRIDKIEHRIGIIEERLLLIEQRIGRIEQKVEALEVKVDNIENRLTIIEKTVVNLDRNINKKIDTSVSQIIAEFLGIKELQEITQDLYGDYGIRITKNEENIRLLGAFVGYSPEESVSVVAKDADSLSKQKPSFPKRSKPFNREEFIRKFKMLD